MFYRMVVGKISTAMLSKIVAATPAVDWKIDVKTKIDVVPWEKYNPRENANEVKDSATKNFFFRKML